MKENFTACLNIERLLSDELLNYLLKKPFCLLSHMLNKLSGYDVHYITPCLHLYESVDYKETGLHWVVNAKCMPLIEGKENIMN